MKEGPMLFNAPMVRATLDDRKTQTRRVAKLTDAGHVKEQKGHRRWHPSDPDARLACPYGQPGDRLWVREAWAHDAETLDQCRTSLEDAMGGGSYGPYYRATESAPDTLRWRPSIHMPRWASRILLEIVSVRVERLQDINEVDAIAEGIEPVYGAWRDYQNKPSVNHHPAWSTAIGSYRSLWESINGASSWDLNPFVWVIKFKRLSETQKEETV